MKHDIIFSRNGNSTWNAKDKQGRLYLTGKPNVEDAIEHVYRKRAEAPSVHLPIKSL